MTEVKKPQLGVASRKTKVDTPPKNWFKWNTDACRLESKRSTTISYVYREDNGKSLDNFDHSMRLSNYNCRNLSYSGSNKNNNREGNF